MECMTRTRTKDLARREKSDGTQRKIRWEILRRRLQDVGRAEACTDYSFDASNLDKRSGITLHYASSEPTISRSTQVRGQCHGFCPAQRKRLLPGAQRAPRRKSAAVAPGAARRSRPHHGRNRQGSLA